MRTKIGEKSAEKGKILSNGETDAESFKRIISDTDMLTDPRGLASISEASPELSMEITSLLEGVRAKIEGNGEVDFSGNTVENGDVKGYDGNVGLDGNSKYKPQDLMDELAASGVKYNLDKVVSVKKDANGKLLWLEIGNESSGLTHILEGHKNNFVSREVYDVVEFLDELLETEPYVTGSNRRGAFSEYSFDGNNYRVAYGTNGYIVSFYPID